MKITPDDRNLGIIPLGHSYGLGNLVLPLISQGTTLIVASAFVPAQISKWIQKYRITIFPSVPAIFKIMTRLPGQNSLKPLRLVISAAAPLPPETAQAFTLRYGLRLHNFYGSSETGGICFDAAGHSTLAGTSLGPTLPGVTLKIQKNGRLQVSSRAVAHASGSYLLPDLGTWTEEGELRLLGRTGQMLNVGGKKISPVEVENLLRSWPAVTDAWVSIAGPSDRPYLAAMVETKLSAKKILTHLTAKLPSWKLPRILKTAPNLPRTERGKLDTKKLNQLIHPS
jgi:acyl-coenzyme A synthetase/AMP-(fatty) acid ligase